MKQITMYEANDGKTFATEQDCRAYENLKISKSVNDMLRGKIEMPDLFYDFAGDFMKMDVYSIDSLEDLQTLQDFYSRMYPSSDVDIYDAHEFAFDYCREFYDSLLESRHVGICTCDNRIISVNVEECASKFLVASEKLKNMIH